MVLSRLVSLSISLQLYLNIKANKFYDGAHRIFDATILTRCYTQQGVILNKLFDLILTWNLIILGI